LLTQRTLKSRISATGIALHSGRLVQMALIPAPPSTGIVFARTDLRDAQGRPVEVQAHADNVLETRLATTLGRDAATVGTVEHLMAALSGLGIDNVRVELDGPEVPIFDGSAAPFVELVREAGGAVAQSRPKRFLVIRRAVEVRDGDRVARLEPAPSFRLQCYIDFRHPLITDQRRDFEYSDVAFEAEIARARTFGFARDVVAMRARGLALGGSLDNAVVIDDYSIQNPEGLRFPDEFVRHKILDAIGDLALIGAPIVGRYVGYKSGHMLNTKLVSAVLAERRAYEWQEFRHERDARGAGLELPALRLGGLATA
jgi:UDP-3-O-[3-hydroxymyristoyl] N-acetylglucosamine deacetylase